MILARVVGNVVATVKHPAYHAHKLLIVQPEDPFGRPEGHSKLAIDRVQAGVGDSVLVLEEGSSARLLLDNDVAPARTVIVGVIDHVDIEDPKEIEKAGKEG